MRKITVTPECSAELRQLAKVLMDASATLTDSSNTYWFSMQNASQDYGIHEDDFNQFMTEIKKTISLLHDGIGELPERLNKIADDIDSIIAQSSPFKLD